VLEKQIEEQLDFWTCFEAVHSLLARANGFPVPSPTHHSIVFQVDFEVGLLALPWLLVLVDVDANHSILS